MWGLGDYPVTPEAHLRKIRRLGDECLAAADAALNTVKTNRDEAERIRNYMRGYKLLTVYYEEKVLAAVAALIYGFGGDAACRKEAEEHADLAVEAYREAITFLWDAVDKKSGQMKGNWLGGKSYTLPELIEREEDERKQLATLFRWPARGGDSASARGTTTAPKAGTFAPEKK
jgi:hypothetical protein